MAQKYIDKFSDSELRDISHLGGFEITSEIALSELKNRRNQKTNKITFYENKFFIKKTDDKIILYKTGSYNVKNKTIPYDSLTLVAESDTDFEGKPYHEGFVQFSVDESVTTIALEWKFDGFTETTPEVWHIYLNKYHIIFNDLKTIIKE